MNFALALPAEAMPIARLPPLREDLRLFEAAAYPDGSPSWTIQDPVGNVFYRIGWLEHELLCHWHIGDAEALLAAAAHQSLLRPSREELTDLLTFLRENHLLAEHDTANTARLLQISRRQSMSRATWLLHHYLFFRIPLWHPDRWLARSLTWLRWIFTPAAASVVLALTLLGLALTARQIDVFAASFVDTLTPGGLLGYLLALAVAKLLHELGHAYTATRHGVRVAHMGVAFLVLWPMLYTDTGESWRLRDRRQRLAIASAGIVTELALAGLATLAWNLAEPGDTRQALFFLATTAWLLSLGLNASPFMRFDGYFILSDAIDMPNLHERSFALARTFLRRLLLGWDEADAEDFPPLKRRLLIAFAITTWLYRLVIFIGIAVAVYVFFFKLLGLFLFAVEIAWFVVRPLHGELKVWQSRRDEIRPSRRRLAAWGAAGLVGLALLPWNLSVDAPAWAHAESAHVIHSPLPGRLETLPQAGSVARDAELMVLSSPEAILRRTLALAGSAAIEQRLVGLAGLPEGEEKRPQLESQHAMKLAEAGAEFDEQERLRLRAPIAGLITDIDNSLAPGVWVAPRQPLATVVAPQHWRVEAFVGQSDLARLTVGNGALFYPADDPLSALPGEVEEIDSQRLAVLPHHLLSSRHGGELGVLQDADGMTPREALYRVRIRLHTPPPRLAVRRGHAVITAEPRSWFVQAVKSLLVVAIREASF